jgi:flagellar FliJ protein
MANHSSLNMLIDLTKDGADQAGKQLQLLAVERDNAQNQFSMLQDYRQDYADRLQKATVSGLSASNYHNFRQFIATLDDAISQQNRVVAQIDKKIENARQHWYAEKRRLNSYETLVARQVRQQMLQENRREQIASDEISANLYRRTRQPH